MKLKKEKVEKPIKEKRVKTKKVRTKKPSKLNLMLQGPKKNLVVGIGLTALFAIISIGLFVALSQAFSTETYYVLNTDVQSRQQITVDMLSEQVTSKGTGPQNALTIADVQKGNVYSRYALFRGDVLSASNAGEPGATGLGIPDSWAVTSFNVSTDDATGGIMNRGDFVDILGVNETGAQYIFHNVLLLDVGYTNSEVADADGQSKIGELLQYTIGMPSADIAVLHSALNDYDNIKVIKAPANTQYGARDITGLDKTFKWGQGTINKDLFEGVDPTFTPVVRDENGLPVNKANCKAGVISPIEKCTELELEVGTKNEAQKPQDKVETPSTEAPADTKPAE